MGTINRDIIFNNIWNTITTEDHVTSTMFQIKLFQASDGTMCAVIQNGTSAPPSGTAGLILLRSLDNGVTWTVVGQISFSNLAVASGVIDENNDIYLGYSVVDDSASLERDAFFRKLTWVGGSQTWTIGTEVLVYDADATHGASYSGITKAKDGVLWCIFRLYDSTDYEGAIFYSEDDGATWIDSLQRIGTKNSSIEKAFSIMSLSNQVAIIFHDNDGITDSKNWAIRNNSDAKNVAWIISQLTTVNTVGFGNHQRHAINQDDDIIFIYENDDPILGRRIFSLFRPSGGSWGSPELPFSSKPSGDHPTIMDIGNGEFVGFATVQQGVNQTLIASVKYKVGLGWQDEELFRYRQSSERFFNDVALFAITPATTEDLTGPCSSIATGDIKHSFTDGLVSVVGDYALFGLSEQFDYIFYNLDIDGVGGVISWQYWNGSTWAVLSVVNSQNQNFEGDGYFRFTIPGDWTQKQEFGKTNFWIKAEVITTDFTTKPIGTQISPLKFRRRLAVPEKYTGTNVPAIIREGIIGSVKYFIQSVVLDVSAETVQNISNSQGIAKTENIYQGDPRVFLDQDGSYLNFKGGQPTLDRGLENLVLMSLFTSPGWAGNVLFSNEDQRVESDFEKIGKQSVTLQMINDLENAALRSLVNPALGNVSVEINNPVGHRLDVIIIVEPPGQDIQTLIISRNGANWLSQAKEPAYLRG